MIKITKTTTLTTEEAFVETLTTEAVADYSASGATEKEATDHLIRLLEKYSLFLENQSKDNAVCLCCGRRFKPQQKSAASSKKATQKKGGE